MDLAKQEAHSNEDLLKEFNQVYEEIKKILAQQVITSAPNGMKK